MRQLKQKEMLLVSVPGSDPSSFTLQSTCPLCYVSLLLFSFFSLYLPPLLFPPSLPSFLSKFTLHIKLLILDKSSFPKTWEYFLYVSLVLCVIGNIIFFHLHNLQKHFKRPNGPQRALSILVIWMPFKNSFGSVSLTNRSRLFSRI